MEVPHGPVIGNGIQAGADVRIRQLLHEEKGQTGLQIRLPLPFHQRHKILGRGENEGVVLPIGKGDAHIQIAVPGVELGQGCG